MKRIFTTFMFWAATFALSAQPKPFIVAENANHFVYATYEYGEHIDTQYTQIELDGGSTYLIIGGENLPGEYRPASTARGPFIKGYSVEDIFVNEEKETVTYLTTLFDGDQCEHYRTESPFSRKDIQFDTAQVNGLIRYACFINSNKLEFYVQPYKAIWNSGRGRGRKVERSITPVPYYGRFSGLLVGFWRNGQCRMQLVKTDMSRNSRFALPHNVPVVTNRELSRIKREKMVITTRVFDSVQLCWCGKDNHIEGNYRENTPFDSILHYAGGTLALKRLRLPKLSAHYQTFIELHQRSNGDAYDRTGSVFVIPGAQVSLRPNFFDGINNHPDSLPLFVGRDGERYQGIIPAISYMREYLASSFVYEPPVELMRFFTPFGVGQFNERVKIDNLDWQEEAYYKQDVTDLCRLLQGEVWIGIWIGNYDRGGHTVTLDIKSYPGESSVQTDSFDRNVCRSLFNTCNLLEMAGQNYGKLFATDSLTTSFDIYDTTLNYRLRYMATGHGGWDGGDEFNPKTHTILVDGQPAFTHIPWRGDCGRYREWNPVSGNFWNGMSSSDFSRSGWCPGTATQPVYFDLTHYFCTHGIAPQGKHTISVAIPQGEPQAGSFSYWCVSGVLLGE